MAECRATRHVCLVAVPEASAGTVTELFEALQDFSPLSWVDPSLGHTRPFSLGIVAPGDGPLRFRSGLTLAGTSRVDEVTRTDIVIVPPLMVPAGGDWQTGRYPETVAWLRRMHDAGAQLCSACTGLLLLAETGLLDGRTATTHWAIAEMFRRTFPAVSLDLDKTLIVAGERQQFLLSGAASAWQDLALCLIARYLGTAVAQACARFHALNAHVEGMAPYRAFLPRLDHDDAAVQRAQHWIGENLACAAPVDSMSIQARLSERNFKRRFTRATGLTPLRYVQELRIDQAKKLLERTREPVHEIAWLVGYEDPAFFRRLFKRLVGITAHEHRRRFSLSRLESGAAV
ncbi:helix-turn-helix domain-containing protein [Aquisalimonas lutea]|uniref:GlxA family transcriptional regulator n=1 Tax=Aquisalimonas lutea TaxID=1327750 RepID=UPI0025B316B5|nr:helix-turn-helix domain-containing protein [Aquisalimonas lutea]MDN3519396.1 helix-turn-helix domain-containing protein [Aquisalimonas lutea]